jgi:hypothetical protein
MSAVFSPPRRCSLMPFFDKNRDKAVYVFISFSRKLTTRRFDSFIAHHPAGLDASKKHENDNNE